MHLVVSVFLSICFSVFTRGTIMVPVRIPAFQNGAKILSRNFHVLQYINVRHVSVSFD